MATLTEIASHLFMSVARVKVLQGTGAIPKSCTLDQARESYILNLRKKSTGTSTERNRLDAARADLAELDLAQKRGELVSRDEVQVAWMDTISSTVTKVRSVPSKVAAELAAEGEPAACERIMQVAQDDALRDLARMGADQAAEALEALARLESDARRDPDEGGPPADVDGEGVGGDPPDSLEGDES